MNGLRFFFTVESGLRLAHGMTKRAAATCRHVQVLLASVGLSIALTICGMLGCGFASAASVDPLGITSPGTPPVGVTARQLPAGRPAAAPAAASPEIKPLAPQQFDYSANLNSDVFGANLFSGTFAREGAAQFHPDYLVAAGDRIQVRLWGAFEFDAPLIVDPKGNIFIPHVGPVPVLGVRNQDLQRVVELGASRVFRANVYSYASLAAAQPVRVFVSGFVNRPGLYAGTSMDSLLHYLDQAGGIDTERGSFLDIQVKRGERTRATVSLYDFLLAGKIPLIQLSDGDVVFVGTRQRTVKVSGLAENAKRFEFGGGGSITVADLARLAKPRPQATHARVVRNTGTLKSIEYFSLAEATEVRVADGDEVEFTADKKPGTISVRVEGEHRSPQEYVLPYGAKLGDLIVQIELSERSEAESIQLFRVSVRERQRQALQTTLKFLENAALTARSATTEEALLRKEEAELLLKWVERGKSIEPSGQVYIAQSATRNDLSLENGDILRIPARDGLVLVSGEVVFPNAIAYEESLGVREYIENSGGYTQNADASRVVVAHRDGSFESSDTGGWWSVNYAKVRPGDHILVLPKIDVKSRQIYRDVVDALFKIAVIAGIAAGI
ncbi:polysaccharide biosynthesis/export family protein [Accumulibacter sp.]|uniref:polysaccharide biosynthesis/export family protein n=1 Tax=Accumulibacter sp. TaxID=2053492 RepID=UPI0025E6BFA5|nr:polysaccharide biosynthesis/export family protein [Accumulibacter sp.]MCM8612191.1 polysaccharide export protein [Accumulibacter sp.]MCM8635864.1 polysaccharide export protein [Accumulibacter sp.]MCM8639527.1 polysaccharide export protein [Accumulibacter sp.]